MIQNTNNNNMKPHTITAISATSFTLGAWAVAALPSQAVVFSVAGLATIAALTTLNHLFNQ